MKKNKRRTQHNYEVSDLLKCRIVNDLRVSPDGLEVLFEMQTVDEAQDTSLTQLWIAPTSNKENAEKIQLFSSSLGSDSDPRWSPDGKKIAFISDRSNDTFQIFLIDRSGGEAKCLSKFENGSASFSWYPDGKNILAHVTLEVEEKPEEIEDDEWEKRPKVIKQLHYKSDGNGFTLRKKSHLFRVNIEDLSTKQLTNGDFDVFSSAVSPNGKHIAFGRTRKDIREPHQVDLWLMKSDGSHKQQLTCQIASVADPSWSPNGRWIAFNGSDECGNSVAWLSLYDLNTNEVKTFKDDEIETGPVLWSEDSQFLTYVRAEHGVTGLVRMNIQTEEKEVLVASERQIKRYHAGGSKIAYYAISLINPGDIYCLDLNNNSEKKITAINHDWLNNKKIPRVEKRKFKIDKTHEIEGWLLLPPDKKGPYPLLVDVHGGPHSYVEFSYSFHVYWYALISKGWAIIALNPTGSSSFGEKFKDELRGAWGEKDLKQHLAAVKSLQKEGLASERVAIAGKSYGGYMSAWAVGHTDIFKAAVVSAPVSNLESHAGTSDSGYYVGPYDMNAELLKRRELYRKLSPVTYAHKVRTPTLVLEGEEDQRCPIGQAEEFFTAVMRNGKAQAEMVLYPDGHHNMAEEGKPSHRVDYHQRIVDWVEKWCH